MIIYILFFMILVHKKMTLELVFKFIIVYITHYNKFKLIETREKLCYHNFHTPD
jgi:hypothetical protein